MREDKRAGPGRPDVGAMLLSALMAALIAAASQIIIPTPLVPINLALLPVFLCGFLLPRRWVLVPVALYLAMGALGLPVFAGLRGGPHVLAGPTGGYLLGYLLACGAVALLRGKVHTAAGRFLVCAAALVSCYIPGTLWLAYLTGRTVPEALLVAVLPFLPGDALKCLAAALLAPPLTKAAVRILK